MGVVFSSTEDVAFCSEKECSSSKLCMWMHNLKYSRKSFRWFLFKSLTAEWVLKLMWKFLVSRGFCPHINNLWWRHRCPIWYLILSPTWARQSKSGCVVKFSILPDDSYLLFLLWQRCWLGHRAGWTVWCHCSLPPQRALQKGRPQSRMGLNPLHFWHTQKESWSPGRGMKYK